MHASDAPGHWSKTLNAFAHDVHADTWLAHPNTNVVQIYTAHDTDSPSRLYIHDKPIVSLREFHRAVELIMAGNRMMYERVMPRHVEDPDTETFLVRAPL